MAREADLLLPTHAGPEIGVASTKAFTCQLAVLAALAANLARAKGRLSRDEEQEIVAHLQEAPAALNAALGHDDEIAAMAHLIAPARDVLYLGRGPDYPMALEGALKLKEISYIHAEGYAAGEMKHGPIALIDDDVPVIVLAPSGPLFEKTVSNMQEVRARGGKIVLISDAKGIAEAGEGCMATIEMPQVHPLIAPLVYAVPVQLLAYHVGGAQGHRRRPAAQPRQERDGRVSRVRCLVIVGGGAAGIGAAKEAHSRGIDALIVEAKDRLGGRARSIAWNGHQLDLGCTWMHSAERNSLRMEAERIGAAIDRSPTGWFGQYRNLGFSAEEQAAAGEAFEQLEARLAADPPPSDRASDAIEPGNPWNPWLEALSSYINGAALSLVSVADWLAYDNSSSAQNWRLPGGYGALRGDPRRCSSIIGWRHPCRQSAASPIRVRLTTGDGVIEAERVIVTVPTSTLHKIRFDPPIEGLFEAAEQLPLGIADKLFLALDDAEEFPNDAHLLGNPRSAETGSYFLRPLGMPVVEGYFGGDGARALEGMSDEAAAASQSTSWRRSWAMESVSG